ncbi:unnamed protein product [Pylaiella littoralis]
MLDQLALMVNAANQVECAHRQSAFGHLIVVLRDVPRESHEGQKLVFDDEDLGAASRGEQDSINQRNRSRAELRSAFKSIQMLALPSPHEDIDWSDGVNLTDLKPSFKEVMTKFRDLVAKLLADPHTFGGEPVLGGDILSKLLSDVCANVNDKKNDIAPCSLMESILKKPVDDLRAKAEKDFHRVATFESGDGIHSEADTTLFIDGARRDAVTSFNRGAQDLTTKIADKARIVMEERLLELSEVCFMMQDRKVAQLKLELSRKYLDACDELGKQMSAMETTLPMRGKEKLDKARQMCIDRYRSLNENISAETAMTTSLREEVGTSIPTEAQFMDSLEASFGRLRRANEEAVKLGNERQAAADRDRMMEEKLAWNQRVTSRGGSPRMRTGSVGGHVGGGRPFYIDGLTSGGNPFTIIGLWVWSGKEALRGIEVETSIGAFGQKGTTKMYWGTKVGRPTAFKFDQDETIDKLSLWGNGVGMRCGAIRFVTNKGREFFVKMEKGLKTEYEKEVGSGILVGIYGNAGADIDHLGFYFVKRVQSRKLTRLDYPTLRSADVSMFPTIQTRENINRSNESNKHTFEVGVEVQQSETWEKTDIFERGVTSSIKVTGEVGVPSVASVKVEAGVTGSVNRSTSDRWSKTFYKKKTVKDTHTTTVPPWSRVEAIHSVSHTHIDVPFTAQVELTMRDGSLFEYKIYGRHRSVSVSRHTWDLKVTALKR